MAVSSELRARLRQLWGPLSSGWQFRTFGSVLEHVERPVEVFDDKLYRQPVIRRNHGGLELRNAQLGREIKTKQQFEIKAGDWLMSKVQIMHRAYGIVPPELDGAIASGSYFAF